MKKYFLSLFLLLPVLVGAATIQWFTDQPQKTVLTGSEVIALQQTGPNTYRFALLSDLRNYTSGTSNSPITVLYVSNLYATNIYATNAYFTNIFASNAYFTNLYVTNLYAFRGRVDFINATTNYYFFTTNLYTADTYVSNYFVTNVFNDITVSNYLQTSYYVTNQYTTNLYSTNIVNNNNYVSNFWQTNIFNSSPTYVSNYFMTNVFVTDVTNIYNTFNTTLITNLFTTNLYVNNAYTTNLYTTYFSTNYYLFNTNIYQSNSYVSNYFTTNVFTDVYVSNYFNTNYFVTNQNTFLTVTNYYAPDNYVSNFFQTNIFFVDNSVSNYFVTNLYAPVNITSNYNYLVSAPLTNATLYGTTTFAPAVGTTNAYMELRNTNNAARIILDSGPGVITLYGIRTKEVPWAGPTNSIDFAPGALQFYRTYTPISVTNYANASTDANQALLVITNASSSNVSFYLPTGLKLGNSATSPITITNSAIYEMWFMWSSNRWTGIGQSFQ